MWWTLIAVKGSWSYSDQQAVVFCLMLESSCAPALHRLHGTLHKCSGHPARLINTAQRGVLVLGPQAVDSPAWSWGWVWGSASARTQCAEGKSSARSNPASRSAVVGAVGGTRRRDPSEVCALAGGRCPGPGSALASPRCSPGRSPWGAVLLHPLPGPAALPSALRAGRWKAWLALRTSLTGAYMC